jgi:hypothetical protein
MWQHWGYFAGYTPRQVENAIYAQCHAIGCQWQPELPPGGCPSQYGVEQVAASWGMPGYVDPPQWSWYPAIRAAAEARAIIFWRVGGVSHAYYCAAYDPPPRKWSPHEGGRLFCYDALNVNGRWWDETTVRALWTGWSAGWRP